MKVRIFTPEDQALSRRTKNVLKHLRIAEAIARKNPRTTNYAKIHEYTVHMAKAKRLVDRYSAFFSRFKPTGITG